MIRKMAMFIVACIGFTVIAQAQIREIPTVVKDAFTAQYPDADSIVYKDYLTTVSVYFREDGQKLMASYDSKGAWRQTEKEWNFDQLPQEVKDGFQKSKYADWKGEEAYILSLPAKVEQYRIKAAKNDIQKKYLYFNKSGRLVRDAITI